MSVRELPKVLQEIAVKELNEDVKRREDDIKFIQNWLSQNKYLTARTDDQWILSFLRGCKFSLERTKEKLDTYYTLRSLAPELTKNRDPMQPEIQKILKLGLYLPITKNSSPNSPRLILMRVGFYDAASIDPNVLFKTILMIQDILINEDDQFNICGVVVIEDMKSISLAHTPSAGVMKKAITILQNAYPVRPKGTHFINISSVFEMMFNVVKPFLNEKVRSRTVVYSDKNVKDLVKKLPKADVPKEYGGDGPSIDELTEYWKEKVESYRDFFIEDDKYGTDEKKRPGRPKTSDEIFGIQGSFRKLDLD